MTDQYTTEDILETLGALLASTPFRILVALTLLSIILAAARFAYESQRKARNALLKADALLAKHDEDRGQA